MCHGFMPHTDPFDKWIYWKKYIFKYKYYLGAKALLRGAVLGQKSWGKEELRREGGKANILEYESNLAIEVYESSAGCLSWEMSSREAM